MTACPESQDRLADIFGALPSEPAKKLGSFLFRFTPLSAQSLSEFVRSFALRDYRETLAYKTHAE